MNASQGYILPDLPNIGALVSTPRSKFTLLPSPNSTYCGSSVEVTGNSHLGIRILFLRVSVPGFPRCLSFPCDYDVMGFMYVQHPPAGCMQQDRIKRGELTYPLQYFGFTNGIGVTMAFLNLFLTSISTSVPFLCHPFSTYPIAIFFSKVGDGIPDVMAPMRSPDEGLKILAPSAVDESQTPHGAGRKG